MRRSGVDYYSYNETVQSLETTIKHLPHWCQAPIEDKDKKTNETILYEMCFIGFLCKKHAFIHHDDDDNGCGDAFYSNAYRDRFLLYPDNAHLIL